MKIQYCSDLHLEFKNNAAFISENPLKCSADILLLAGDIVPFSTMSKHEQFFDDLSHQFEFVYWVPGNHEYYYSDFIERSGSFIEKIRDNVFLLNDEVIHLNGVRFIFSTLWTRISPINRRAIQQGLADYHCIEYQGESLNCLQVNSIHKSSRDFLMRELPKHSCHTVVVSHHVPTFKNYPAEYLASPLNEGFAVELENLIDESGINFWLYGHHHQNVPGFEIGQTSLLTNQLGYVSHGEHLKFNSEAIFCV